VDRSQVAPHDRLEGLAWLGRSPEARAGIGFRTLVALGRLVGARILGLRLRTEGLETLPRGGYILACAIHRSWADPLVLLAALPPSPRLWYIGSAEIAFRSRLRTWFVRRTGGFLPVWRGGTDLAVTVEAAQAVVDVGAVLAIFPEGSRRGTPSAVEPLRRGTALIALRTGAPIVPVALAGSHELYRGRRLALRVLPATTALELAGLDDAPPVGSAAEIAAIHRASDALRGRLQPDVSDLASWCEDPPGTPKRWRWLSGIVR
ncbi:MAG TPA: 1-acyl-sn-glycerol-3-phosphate acyltransferase, partial [Candidatus Dormibacteraeota bacterium]|nr:1-acyl-sn-glycerol-3-phosphate acyltransferase [Candidatus Dormibacteraeota bacterium]